jgi:hypothetical protein
MVYIYNGIYYIFSGIYIYIMGYNYDYDLGGIIIQLTKDWNYTWDMTIRIS